MLMSIIVKTYMILLLTYVEGIDCKSLNKDGFVLPMYFEASTRVKLLFDSWVANDNTSFILVCVAVFLFGVLSVLLKALRKYVELALMSRDYHQIKFVRFYFFKRFPIYHNMIRGVVAFLNYTWDYMLMLVAMTFNVAVFISLMGGFGFGILTAGHLVHFDKKTIIRNQLPCCGCACSTLHQESDCKCGAPTKTAFEIVKV